MGSKACQSCRDRRARLCDECAASAAAAPIWTPFLPAAPVLGRDPGSARLLSGAEIWMNSRYVVAIRRREGGPLGPMVHLSIRRLDRAPIRDWRDLQRVKNELVGCEAEGVELFPAESRLVDTANQYHLYVFTEHRFPFGANDRLVGEAPTGGAVQRPFDERPPDALSGSAVDERLRRLMTGGDGAV